MLKNIGWLDVAENHLSGDIPGTIGECISLESLQLQGNSFNGTIPSSFASLKGEVPTNGVFENATQVALIGNNKLCGGSGSFGSVYRGHLVSEDNFVAVKVLNLQKKGAHKSFFVEYYKGQEFKALVFDYMKNGSLEQWLHPEILNAEPPTTLDLSHRLNIIIDVASALHYLHRECEQLVIHCDLKPSNVLLDNDMVARVSDFGIARLVSLISNISHKDTSTIGIKGTIGYAPPEYGLGSEVSTFGDMYSFGILMLEMLTGRRPTDEVYGDGQNLHNFVAISFPDNLINILDPYLLSRNGEVAMEDRNRETRIPIVEECLVSLFRIGLICSLESPRERMNIVDVTRELNIIKKAFFSAYDFYVNVFSIDFSATKLLL
ncbi:non-specific serine/threonine protein kinase [Trifolium repens]|nr:non-specific serine/threonine protein kinase [Trifolium repens]